MLVMTPNVAAFDRWIRGPFRDINTELENLYFAQDNRAAVAGVGEALKTRLRDEGRRHILDLLKEGNTDEGFDRGFDLLGNVGFYMAACERHEITLHTREPTSPLVEASALALQLGAGLGVTPRFATSHLATHNRAVDGVFKGFTTLPDERLFHDYNARGILGYKRAADALVRALPLGVTHPVLAELLKAARDALGDVAQYNADLFRKLDVDRFFYSVRPYFKPHRVGLHVYRGANAGDFAGINIIDLLLGLCQADHAYYSQLLVDKFLYMLPEDQALLRDCMRRESLMDAFLAQLDAGGAGAKSEAFRTNLALFLEACAAHGRTAAQHHDELVQNFIARPAEKLPQQHHENLTASGPPLPVLLRALEKLRDLRLAADRADIPTRYKDIRRLKAAVA